MSNQGRQFVAILRRPQVEELLGLKRSTIYDKLNRKSPRYDPTFPRPIRLGGNSVGWDSVALDRWIADRVQASAIGQ